MSWKLNCWTILLVVTICTTLLSVTTAAKNKSNEMLFDKVEIRTTFGTAEEGDNGKLAVSGEAIRFVDKKGREHFSIPSNAINEIFYSRVSGRRIKTAIVVSPLLLFSKGKKHYMTLSFNDGSGLAGAVEFRLHKKNYRGVLHAIESVSGVTLEFDQEGIKDEKETLASSGARSEGALATLEITSDPEGAEIQIDGAFEGMTPRTKKLQPGEYEIKLKLDGYEEWRRKIQVTAGEAIPINATLEKD